MTLPIPEFDPTDLNLRECEELIDYYRQIARELNCKLLNLRTGAHTIMCQTTLDTLDAILHVYRERITALANLIDILKARIVT